MVKISKWIDVKTEKPFYNENVLAVDANSHDTEPIIAYYDYETKEWWSIAWWDFDLFSRTNVTHWMPLPKFSWKA